MRESLPSDTFDASHNGPRCVQPPEPNTTIGFQSHLDFPSDVTESEFDCLNLFITRPSKAALNNFGLGDQLLPVYAYIHGGGYGFGAGTDPMWDPARLVQRSLILKKPFIAVHINYRLDLFGFAASSDILSAQQGQTKGLNFGLGDQRIALEWIRKNISAFGGDPNKVTVGGQSAGASSSHAHALNASTSMQKPLLRRAIVQSGAVGTLGPQPIAEADSKWQVLCKHFGVSDLSPEERFHKLCNVPADELLAAGKAANWWVFPLVEDGITIKGRAYYKWKISLESSIEEEDEDSKINGLDQPITVLIGDTDVEGTVYFPRVFGMKSMPEIMAKIQASAASEAAKATIMEAYGFHGDEAPNVVQDKLFTFLTDIEFGLPVQNAREDLSLQNNHDSKRHSTQAISYRVKYGNPFPGPCYDIAQHCVDLIYIYDCFHEDLRKVDRSASDTPGTATNASLVEQMQEDWIDFITSEDNHWLSKLSDDMLTVYGKDRTKKIVAMANDEEYQQRKSRLAMLKTFWQEARVIKDALAKFE